MQISSSFSKRIIQSVLRTAQEMGEQIQAFHFTGRRVDINETFIIRLYGKLTESIIFAFGNISTAFLETLENWLICFSSI